MLPGLLWLLFLSAAIPSVLYAQNIGSQKSPVLNSEVPSDSNVDLTRLKKQIIEIESQFDAYSPELGEANLELASVLKEMGNYEEALLAYRRALHITRINAGLASPAQTPLLITIKEIQSKIGDTKGVVNTLSRMLATLRQSDNPSAPEIVNVLKEITTHHLSAHYFKLSSGKSLHIVRASRTLSLMLESYDEAQLPYDFEIYQLALLTYYKMVDYELAEKIDHNRSPVHERTHENPRHSVLSYRRGTSILKKGITKAAATGNTLNMVKASMLYGDWQQLFKKRNAARNLYAGAYQMLKTLDEQEREGVSFNRPIQLPELPTSLLEMLPMNAMPVPLDMNINRWGVVRHYKVIEDQNNRRLRGSAAKFARSSLFRPAIMNNEFLEFKGQKQTILLGPRNSIALTSVNSDKVAQLNLENNLEGEPPETETN